MEFRMLGRLEVESAGADLTPGRPKQVTALGLLLLHADEVVSTDALIDALWGERPPATAQTALHGHVSALRKRLGAERIETHPRGYLLRLRPDDEIDARRFERLVADAEKNGPLLRADKLREALALFRGEPLAEFLYDSFARGESQRLEELRLAAFEALVDAELQLGRHVEVLSELERLIIAHPYRERLRGQLMVALYRAGRQADALAAFGEGRRVLVEELGIEPSPALRQLERRILSQDVELAAPDVLAPAGRPADGEPSGVVTFLLARGAADHELARTVVGQHGGAEVEVRGPSLLASFARARDAAGAAVGIERVTHGAVRIGIHSAEATAGDERLTAADGRSAASICGAAHDGQILCSRTTRDLLRESRLDNAAIHDLGEYRLSDLAPPQRLFQLVAPGLASAFPPPIGLDARPTNLPLQATRLVGRGQEIRELADLLEHPDTRLVTLTGPGGTGKTRLAAHAAAELLDEFTDGVFFVALAGLADPRLVLPTLARTLGVAEGTGGTVSDQLKRHLRGRRVLIVLDNAEHLLAAAPAIEELASSSAGLRVLVTSRMPLRVQAEATYAVAPLPEPVGVALFTACARSARPDFAVTPETAGVVADICTALDGLPLAIELAAARISVLPPAALLERLDGRLQLLKRRAPDVAARHVSLRAAIDWSYDLLGSDEQKLFTRLAVFVDGWTLASVDSICGEDTDVVDQLSALVDASLVVLQGTDEEPRFAMLETIRAYADELLDESDEGDQLGRRHTAHFLSVAEEAEPNLRESPGRWLERLEQDHNNLRAALDRVTASGEEQTATRLAGALWRFWYLKGHLTEGQRRLEHALANDTRPTAARARALIGAAVMAVNCGDSAAAIRWAEEGVEASSALEDSWGVAYSRFMLGNALANSDLARTQQLLEESADTFRRLGDWHSMLLVTRRLATIADEHDHERARALHEDNLRVARATANPRVEASTLGALASIAVDEGRLDDAVAMVGASLGLHQSLGDLLDTAIDLCRSAVVLSRAHNPTAAVQILASYEGFRENVGIRSAGLADMNDETLAATRLQLDAEAFAGAWEKGRRLTSDEALALALAELA